MTTVTESDLMYFVRVRRILRHVRRVRRTLIAEAFNMRQFRLRERYYRLWYTCKWPSDYTKRRDRFACPFWAFPRCKSRQWYVRAELTARAKMRRSPGPHAAPDNRDWPLVNELAEVL